MLFFFPCGCYYFTLLIVVTAVITPFAKLWSCNPKCFTGADSFTRCPQDAHSCLWFSGPVPCGFLNANQNQNFLRWFDIFKSLTMIWVHSCIRHHNCYSFSVSLCSVIPLSDCPGYQLYWTMALSSEMAWGHPEQQGLMPWERLERSAAYFMAVTTSCVHYHLVSIAVLGW